MKTLSPITKAVRFFHILYLPTTCFNPELGPIRVLLKYMYSFSIDLIFIDLRFGVGQHLAEDIQVRQQFTCPLCNCPMYILPRAQSTATIGFYVNQCSNCFWCLKSGLPDGTFPYPNPNFCMYILDGLGIENFGIFHGHLVSLYPFGI
jgi:hypothetical protein